MKGRPVLGAHCTSVHRNQEDHCTFTLDLFYEHMLSCIFYVLIFVNKAVEDSGSKHAPKYMGEGVTYGVLFRVFIIFSHVHAI